MKIVNKFLFANIITSVILVATISISIYIIVGAAVLDNLTEELIFESAVFEESYISNSRNVDVYKNFISNLNENNKLHGIHTLFLPSKQDETVYVISSELGFEKKLLSMNMNMLFDKPLRKIYDIEIDNIEYLAYNTIISNNFLNSTARDELLVSLISIEEINNIKYDIYYLLFIAILVSILFSANISFYLQNNINKPINKLLKATEEISNKNFDATVEVKTNDEFMVLGNSINSMARNLKIRDKEQKQFYETLSHELKTPVAVISGYVQGLKSGIIKDDNKTYDIIIDECDKLKKQLENTIYLSKLDSLKDSYIFETIDMNKVIIESLEQVESVIIINEIDVLFNPSDEVFVKIDKEKMTRAITNILNNCIKYTEDTIDIKVQKDNKNMVLCISDNGEGFPEKLLNQPFSGNIIGDKGGTGVGLTIIKKIVDNHNGKVELYNKKEMGAVYKITLPIHLDELEMKL